MGMNDEDTPRLIGYLFLKSHDEILKALNYGLGATAMIRYHNELLVHPRMFAHVIRCTLLDVQNVLPLYAVI